jgi:hypothetical protein
MQTVYVGNTLINDVMLGSQRMDDVLQGRSFGNDDDVINFINATGITNTEIVTALDTFVTTLKNDGIWTKLYALYPFVGGTQNTNRVNLINTASFNLGFTGSWVYNDNGISSNGIDTWANTSFFPSSSFSNYVRNSSMAVFVRTDTTSSGYDMGAETNSPSPGLVRNYFISKNAASASQYDIGLNPLTTPSSVTGSGFWIATVSGSNTNNQRIYRNGTNLASKTNLIGTEETPTSSIAIAANNVGGGFVPGGNVNAFTSESYSLASIGQGFTDTQASLYNTAVQTFQTTLGRNV